MEEVTDAVKLHEIRMRVQNIPLSQSPSIAWRLHRAWEYPANNYEDGHPTLYEVEIMNNYGSVVRGVLDFTRALLYLDVCSLTWLIQDRIDAALATYNAGHSPYYRGM